MNEKTKTCRELDSSFYISIKLFVIRPWSRTLEKDLEELRTIPIWMNIRKVPLYMCNSKGLRSIASCVGVPIMLDKQTLNRTGMIYARFSVEIDTSREFPSFILVYLDHMLAFEVDVEYPWKPPMCTHCKTFNNSSIACKKVVEIVQKNPVTQGKKNIPDKEGWVIKGSKRNRENIENEGVKVTQQSLATGSELESQMEGIEHSITGMDTTKSASHYAKSGSGGVIETINMFEVLVEQDLNVSLHQPKQAQWEGIKRNNTGSCFITDQEGGAQAHFIKANDGGPSKLTPSKNSDLKRSGRETHVQELCASSIRHKIMPSWKFLDNYNNDFAGRIWIGWDPCEVKITILHSSSQCIFALVDTVKGFSFVATFVYDNNDIVIRRSLWEDICNFSQDNSRPWIILGDFNSIMSPIEKTGGAEKKPFHYQDLSNCVQEAHLMDLPYSGCFYTWFNKQGATRIGSNIDRIMVNMEWIDQFVDSKAEFLLPGVSDHSPGIASIFGKRKHGTPPFRFFNYMTKEPDFLDLIRRVWNVKVRGNPMYVFMTKLRKVKDVIIDWKRLRFKNLSEQERISRNNILTLTSRDGVVLVDDKEITAECIDFFSKLYDEEGKEDTNGQLIEDLHFDKVIDDTSKSTLIRHITRDGIIQALASIGSGKAPGPDGFSSHFFKFCWAIIGDDFVAAVKNAFKRSKFLKEVNKTFVTLIAKNENPSGIVDYRPIACCEVVYKCIAKIISLRMKFLLKHLIHPCQSSFIAGRSIQDNILVAHEIFRNYHRTTGTPRYTMKIVLRKAYDIVSWKAVLITLKKMGFPAIFIGWIELCITSPKFSILINGSSYGYFGARRGLREGCPLFPYIFVMVMELLSIILQNTGTTNAAANLRRGIMEFSACSGLQMNQQKTSLFASTVGDDELQSILHIMQYLEDKLPVRVLDQRQIARDMVITILGDEANTIFLHDNWHYKGKLSSWIDPYIIYEYFPNDACTVSDFVKNDEWYLPPSYDPSVAAIFLQVASTDFLTLEKDKVMWSVSSSEGFSVKDTHSSLFPHGEKVNWSTLVWFKLHIPRHSFITWVTLHGRLKTRDKLLKWNVIASSSCLFRAATEENEAYMFHALSYLIVQEVWLKLSAHHLKDVDSVANRLFMERWKVNCEFILKQTILCAWIAPTGYDVMINTDGAMSEVGAGFGAIIRDYLGTGGSHSISVETHELQGVELDLKIGLEIEAKCIHLCTDSFSNCLLLNSYDPKPPGRLSRFGEELYCCWGIHPCSNYAKIDEAEFTLEFREILAADRAGKVFIIN
ncbi:uncharacterized protein LOC113273184 [Papaver somniferum]|uniref:uncharacterized protein LOC113273184 n=1 Tax=Papaver somniferum TaxID=3469 RepID=UPI000E6FB26F|nr:uncharacterized protein LOC113273184 [Papaver somniferum]